MSKLLSNIYAFNPENELPTVTPKYPLNWEVQGAVSSSDEFGSRWFYQYTVLSLTKGDVAMIIGAYIAPGLEFGQSYNSRVVVAHQDFPANTYGFFRYQGEVETLVQNPYPLEAPNDSYVIVDNDYPNISISNFPRVLQSYTIGNLRDTDSVPGETTGTRKTLLYGKDIKVSD